MPKERDKGRDRDRERGRNIYREREIFFEINGIIKSKEKIKDIKKVCSFGRKREWHIAFDINFTGVW